MEHDEKLRTLRSKKAAAGAALAGILVLSGCSDPSKVDTTQFEQAIEDVPGVDDAVVDMRWDGLPNDDSVLVGVTVQMPRAGTADAEELARQMTPVYEAAWKNAPMRPALLRLVVTSETIPDDAPAGSGGIPGQVKTHEAKALIFSTKATTASIPIGPDRLEPLFGEWEKP